MTPPATSSTLNSPRSRTGSPGSATSRSSSTTPCRATDPSPTGGTQTCDADERYQLDEDGSYLKGDLLNSALSETWEMPTGCTARDVDGKKLVHKTGAAPGTWDEDFLVPNQETDGVCLSSPMQGVQFGPYPTDQGTPDANFGAAVDGNYGFGDGCFAPNHLDASDPANPLCLDADDAEVPMAVLPGAHDYLVSLEIPDDASGAPMYGVTGEEDINIGHGDQIVPQVPPPACAGALHTVDVADIGDASAFLETGVRADNDALTWTAADGWSGRERHHGGPGCDRDEHTSLGRGQRERHRRAAGDRRYARRDLQRG